MESPTQARQAGPNGFTLIEILMVIGIIAVLASIALPAMNYVRQQAKKRMASLEMANLVAAINQYVATYSRLPASKAAEECAQANTDCPDFTYGTIRSDGSLLSSDPNFPRITSYGTPTYQTCNAELIAILRPSSYTANPDLAALAHSRNPRNLVLFEPNQVATSPNMPGLGPDGVLRDPWGNPYIITIDLSGDKRCLDGFYGPMRKNMTPRQPPEINGSVMVWSFGPDGRVNGDAKTAGPKGKENRDNVLSWE